MSPAPELDPASAASTGAEDLRIEECAVRAWPALESVESDGWLLRATPGVGRRRSNSAIPPAGPDAPPGLDAVESFYRRRGLDPLIQVAPSHRHAELDARLAERGYARESPTLVLRAPLAGSVHPDPWVRLGARDKQWKWAYEAIGGADPSVERVVDRIPGRTAFARALRDGEIAGVGAGVLDGDRVGVFAMGTAVEHRRQGVAGSVLSALLRWGFEAGATGAWLQVEETNHAARRLYAAHGFTPSHRYHYRRLRFPG